MDYTATSKTSPRSLCTAASGGDATRTASCPLQGVCLPGDVSNNNPHLMQVMVFDRQPLETGDEPLFQAMPAGGLSTDRAYQVNCYNPS
jgi:hypothetical protein